jgi:hypothetical protein
VIGSTVIAPREITRAIARKTKKKKPDRSHILAATVWAA